MTGATLSVVVPAYNAAATLPRCLEALRRAAHDDIELIVVDDGSTDDTGVIARRFDAVVARHEQAGGPARARNAGVALAGASVVLFVDADVEVAADALTRVTAAFADDPDLSAVFGSYDDDPAAGTIVSDYRNLLHHFVHQQAQEESTSFWAGLGAVRVAALRQCGGFDERYGDPSIEDIALGARLAATGHRIRLDKQLRGKHLKRWTFTGMVRTDVLARARPWSLLLLRDGSVPRDLNLKARHRASGVLVWLAAGLAAASALLPTMRVPLATIGACAVATVAMLNLDFYRFLARRRGVAFTLAAFPLHVLYYAYASGTFVWCWVEHRVKQLLRHGNHLPAAR